MAEQMKSAVGFSAPGQNRNAIAIGTNKRSPVTGDLNFTMNSTGSLILNFEKVNSPVFELSRVLVRVDHVVRFIENANHSVM